jgi:hypothetical protein
MSLNTPVLLTWRTVAVASQEQSQLCGHRVGIAPAATVMTSDEVSQFEFRVVASVYLPGESMMQPSNAFTLVV